MGPVESYLTAIQAKYTAQPQHKLILLTKINLREPTRSCYAKHSWLVKIANSTTSLFLALSSWELAKQKLRGRAREKSKQDAIEG